MTTIYQSMYIPLINIHRISDKPVLKVEDLRSGTWQTPSILLHVSSSDGDSCDCSCSFTLHTHCDDRCTCWVQILDKEAKKLC